VGWEKLVDSSSSSSSCVVNFAQTNPQPSGTSVGGTSQPNPSAEPMNQLYSRTTIDGSAPVGWMPQETMTSMFGQGYMQAVHSFQCQTLVQPHTFPSVMAKHT
jgi:hypothetical protein